ncbi:MAG TPA: cytochrome c oxidase subunit II [Actinomycetota bacterium]
MNRPKLGTALRTLAIAGVGLALAACAKEAPQDALAPEGPVARQIDALFRPVFWIAAGVFVLVEGLIVFAIIRFRDKAGREEPKQVHGNTRMEIAWTIVPALLLAGISIPMVLTIFDLTPSHEPGPPCPSDEVCVRVIAKQWWWEYEYLSEGEPNVVTANELVIPVGKDVFLELTSDDVIHSFWVPKLAGKQDVVPERTNTLLFSADVAGEWEGQCAEFCALSHANMRLHVRAIPEPEFDAWIDEQRAPAAEPATADAIAGRALFANMDLFEDRGHLEFACIQCHAINGLEGAGARVGPDLTHFASRAKFAGWTLHNDDETVAAWLTNTRALKPGVVMPIFEGFLTPEEIRQLTAYLRSLT